MPDTATEIEAMQRAIEAARQAHAAGDTPFGATLLSAQGDILHTSPNRQNTSHDCMAHAEVVLIQEATRLLGTEQLRGSTVFASGEPCAMCSGVMFWAGITRVVYAATSEDIAEALGGPVLPGRCAELLTSAQPPVTVQEGLLREQAVAVLHGR